MKLAILGGTGATGKLLLELALKAGHEVTAIARNPADITLRNEKLTVVAGQTTQQADMERLLAGHDAVVSAVGSRERSKNTVRSDTVRAVIAAMQKHGIKRFVWLSAAGVGDSADQARRSSFVFGYIIMPLFLKDVYADAAVAEELVRKSGLDWTVVRPAGLNDKPPTGKVDVVPLDQKLPRAYITRADLAQFMLDEVTSNRHVGKMPSIC